MDAKQIVELKPGSVSFFGDHPISGSKSVRLITPVSQGEDTEWQCRLPAKCPIRAEKLVVGKQTIFRFRVDSALEVDWFGEVSIVNVAAGEISVRLPISVIYSTD